MATVNAILYVNATPVFVDIHNLSTPHVSLPDAETKCTSKTKAVIVMHYGGYLADLKAWRAFADRRGLYLIEDAAHAIEEKGTITVATGLDGENQIWIAVSDTGKGISEEHMKKIFDPFLTTKPVGKGTGLGLSLSYGIINKHGGRIEAASQIGKGTRFTVFLPIRQCEEKAAS